MLSPATKIDLHRAQRNLLRAVASFEIIKGIFVLLIGLSAILLVHKDAWVIAESLLALLHISTDRHSAQLFLDFADNLTDAPASGRLSATAFIIPPLLCRKILDLWKSSVPGHGEPCIGSRSLLIPWRF